MEAMIIIMKKKNIIAKQAIGYDSEYMFRTMKELLSGPAFVLGRLVGGYAGGILGGDFGGKISGAVFNYFYY